MKAQLENVESWNQVGEMLLKRVKEDNPNPGIVVCADKLPNPRSIEDQFSPAQILSLQKGAEYIYREDTEENSLQVRTYPDGEISDDFPRFDDRNCPIYHIELDQHNPYAGVTSAIEHMLEDVFKL